MFFFKKKNVPIGTTETTDIAIFECNPQKKIERFFHLFFSWLDGTVHNVQYSHFFTAKVQQQVVFGGVFDEK